MSSSSLENEDLDKVPLVRMEDVQPSRERTVEVLSSANEDEEVYETCIIDDIDYENECIVNEDEDSNIGSMVSLQSEEVYEDDSSNQELIIPEVIDEVEGQHEVSESPVEEYLDEEHLDENEVEGHTDEYLGVDCDNDDKSQLNLGLDTDEDVKSKEYFLHIPTKSEQTTVEIEVPPHNMHKVQDLLITPPLESWPTLEILPGGVIKNTDKYESDSYVYPDNEPGSCSTTKEMMYACAKCSQTFKYLFCLVKHVKWHEDQKKVIQTEVKMEEQKALTKKYICLHSSKKKIVVTERNNRKTPKRLKS